MYEWNYVADKISACWNEYEYCCNNKVVTPFWLWQFDPGNMMMLKQYIDRDVYDIIQHSYMNGDMKRDDEVTERCEICDRVVPTSFMHRRECWPDYCDLCLENI